jgi:hypothetical protein
MTATNLVNINAVIIIGIGAFFAAKGFFREKDFFVLSRTEVRFGNFEHFETMMFQKYNEIYGFILIIVGSSVQIVTMFIKIPLVFCINFLIFMPSLFLGIFFFIWLSSYSLKVFVLKKIDFTFLLHILNSYNNSRDSDYKDLLDKISDRRFAKTKAMTAEQKILYLNKKFRKKLEQIEKIETEDRRRYL